MISTLLGGIGLFLLGMILMTDGLKALAGNALRRILSRFAGGPFSALLSGAAVTALVQSSSATTLTTIGFVSAGLLTFPQALGVIFGANLGTTSTGWLVSMLGLKLSVSAVALPVVGVGALLKLLTRERVAAAGLALAGFGLIFVGIDTLQLGMKGLAERVDPGLVPADTWPGRLLLALIGAAMTVVLQSSSAAVATTLAAVDSGAIGMSSAATLVIGQNVGTTVTAALACLGASVPARRTAVAHILFNLITAIVALAILPWFITAARTATVALEPEPGPICLAAFHTGFNLLGILLFLPWTRGFAWVITHLVPERDPPLTRHLDSIVARAGAVAIEAARRTLMGTAAVLAEALHSHLGARSSRRETGEALARAEAALVETRRFLGRVRSEPESSLEHRRHISILHALDHLDQLGEGFRHGLTAQTGRLAVELGDVATNLAESLGAALEWLGGESSAPALDTAQRMSLALADLRRRQRREVLEQTARGKVSTEDALGRLEAMRWVDRLAYHLWRAIHHLQEPPPGQPEPALESATPS